LLLFGRLDHNVLVVVAGQPTGPLVVREGFKSLLAEGLGRGDFHELKLGVLDFFVFFFKRLVLHILKLPLRKSIVVLIQPVDRQVLIGLHLSLVKSLHKVLIKLLLEALLVRE
jgi:hypothetical protein